MRALLLASCLVVGACRESVIGTYPDLWMPEDGGLPRRPLLTDVCREDDDDLVTPSVGLRRVALCNDVADVDGTMFVDKRGAVFPPEYRALHALCARMNPASKTTDWIADPTLAEDQRAFFTSVLTRAPLARALADVSPDERVAALEAAWLPANGFEHVLCGEIAPDGSVGGMHVWSEYFFAEQEGRADYECATTALEDPDIATVRYRWKPPGRTDFFEKPIGGFHVSMSPACTLAVGYRALKENISPSMVGGVAFRAELYGREIYFALGITAGAVLTQYPVAIR